MDAGLIDAVMAPLLTAVGAVGHKALAKAEDEAADETVRLGQRLLARLRRGGGEASQDGEAGQIGEASDGSAPAPTPTPETARPQLEAAVSDLATDPADKDFQAALRGQVRKALTGTDGVADPALPADLTEILAAAGVTVTASGARSVAVGGDNTGIISTGDAATITQTRR